MLGGVAAGVGAEGTMTHLLRAFAVSGVTSLLGFGVEPLNVPMPCGLVQHSVATLLGLQGFSGCCCSAHTRRFRGWSCVSAS